MSEVKQYPKQEEKIHPIPGNQLAIKTQSTALSAMSEDELINVLRNSLYPGAQTDSIKMVISYCKASGLDPMQKPVHIVPIWDSKASAMRDVVMPGIGLYRTQAARSGEYAGVSDTEFGPDDEKNLGGVDIIFPKWCKVIVKRMLPNGIIAEFAATERWIENYAMKGGKEKSIAPNAMWLKRPYAQLAKCAEAQALRKAFPELGSAPTADEMEGKSFDDGGMRDITPKQEEYQTGTERLRSAVVKTPMLNSVCKAFGEAFTPEEMRAAVELASRLVSDEDKEAANQAYKARLADLKGATGGSDSGKVVESAPKLTYAQIATKLENASDQDNLGVAADLIQYCAGGADQMEELNKLYKRRSDEFKGK